MGLYTLFRLLLFVIYAWFNCSKVRKMGKMGFLYNSNAISNHQHQNSCNVEASKLLSVIYADVYYYDRYYYQCFEINFSTTTFLNWPDVTENCIGYRKVNLISTEGYSKRFWVDAWIKSLTEVSEQIEVGCSCAHSLKPGTSGPWLK